MSDDLNTRLRRMVDDPTTALKLGRLVRATTADVDSRFKYLPPNAAERLLTALLSDDADESVSKLLTALAEEGGTLRSSQP